MDSRSSGIIASTTLEAGTVKNEEARTFPLTAALRRVLEVQQGEADRLNVSRG